MSLLEVGQKVRLKCTGEVGIIVHTWLDLAGDQDAYITFLGKKFPTSIPTAAPYTLRYFTAGLEAIA